MVKSDVQASKIITKNINKKNNWSLRSKLDLEVEIPDFVELPDVIDIVLNGAGFPALTLFLLINKNLKVIFLKDFGQLYPL